MLGWVYFIVSIGPRADMAESSMLSTEAEFDVRNAEIPLLPVRTGSRLEDVIFFIGVAVVQAWTLG